MPKKSSSDKDRFYNLLEKKAYGKVRQDEYEKQQIRIAAHNDLTKKILKKSFQEKFKVSNNVYERIINIVDKVLNEFAQNHSSTNIMDDFRGLDKHHEDIKNVEKAMKGWRNQNTSKYGKHFFKDMYLNSVKLADEIAKMIFPNQIAHKNALRYFLISSLHSKISLTTISFKNKHSRPTPLIPKNSAKHGLNAEIANYINDVDIKSSLSSDIEAYGNYQQKQSENFSKQLDSLIKENSVSNKNNYDNFNNINNSISNNIGNNISNNIGNNIGNNISNNIGNNINNNIANNINNNIGNNINNIRHNINNISDNTNSNNNYNYNHNYCNDYNYDYNNNNNNSYFNNNNNNNNHYFNNNNNNNNHYFNNNNNSYYCGNNNNNCENSDDSTYLSRSLSRSNNSISPNTPQMDNDNSSLLGLPNFAIMPSIDEYNNCINNSTINENFFSDIRSINADQILSQLQDIVHKLQSKSISFNSEQENKFKEIIFNLGNVSIPQKHNNFMCFNY